MLLSGQLKQIEHAGRFRSFATCCGTPILVQDAVDSQRLDVTNVIVEGEFLKFSHKGELADEATLLRDFVQAGFAVVEFGSHSQSLEDVFLAVTKGIVQ